MGTSDCKRDMLLVRFLLEEMKYFKFIVLMYSQNTAFSSATQHTVLPELGVIGHWEWNNLTLGSLCLPCCVRGTA